MSVFENTDLAVSMKHVRLYESARDRGIEFELSHSDVRRLLSRKTCAYTGVTLTRGIKLDSNKPHIKQLPTARTIDRIDATKGYVKGNVVAVSHLANQMKNSLLEWGGSELKTDMKTLKKFVKTLDKLGVEDRK